MIRNDLPERLKALCAAVLLIALTGAAAPPSASTSGRSPEEKAREILACAVSETRIGFAERAEAVFAVEIAADAESQRRGMMWRESLAPDAGMLFVFTPPRVSQFWMMNTLIPLDMIFLDPQGRIQHIEHWAAPGTLEPRGPAHAASAAVLEIAGGRAAELGLALGDLATCAPPEA